MKNQKGNVGVLVLLFIVFMAGSWLVNFYKLTQCDFEADYKCEAIHGVGIIPWVHVATVWVGTDKDGE